MIGKLKAYPELNNMLNSLLFTGKSITYNPDEPAIDMATMFGFIRNKKGSVVIANRIFETRLYNLYLSATEMQRLEIYKASFFLLYLRPIINGTGNFYIESRTRELRRTDVIVDYQGEQYVIEMKIWHGNEYHMRGERQLIGYLDDYHVKTGYMISFNFSRNKNIGVHEIKVGEKTLIEAVV